VSLSHWVWEHARCCVVITTVCAFDLYLHLFGGEAVMFGGGAFTASFMHAFSNLLSQAAIPMCIQCVCNVHGVSVMQTVGVSAM